MADPVPGQFEVGFDRQVCVMVGLDYLLNTND